MALKNELPAISAIAPRVSLSTQIIANGNNWLATVTGSTNDYFALGNWKFELGTTIVIWFEGEHSILRTHLRIVSESGIARYQNILGQKHIVCKAGTVGIFHHGLWHGAGVYEFSKKMIKGI